MTNETVRNVLDAYFDACAAGDFESAARNVAAEAVAWQNTDGLERSLIDVLRTLPATYARFGPWAYHDVRRVIGATSACEQHTTVFSPPGAEPVSVKACVVIHFDSSGSISRVDEYMDPAPLATLGKSSR